MEARFDFIGNPVGANFVKRLNSVGMATVNTPLPEATQNLVKIRASQINGRGARDVGAYALNFSRHARVVEPALVDGAVGLAIVPQGRLFGALGFTFSGEKITGIDMISDPEHPRRVDLAVPGG
jgi:hypothetical protein